MSYRHYRVVTNIPEPTKYPNVYRLKEFLLATDTVWEIPRLFSPAKVIDVIDNTKPEK